MKLITIAMLMFASVTASAQVLTYKNCILAKDTARQKDSEIKEVKLYNSGKVRIELRDYLFKFIPRTLRFEGDFAGDGSEVILPRVSPLIEAIELEASALIKSHDQNVLKLVFFGIDSYTRDLNGNRVDRSQIQLAPFVTTCTR